ncbi:ErfK/YbiS/YcfS/YnhG family protein [Chthoniobacter flavus Ellin428]|uniref:ErfK/YbiS/YcfS/YnhG family protein n=1 Tax=Chthoniobacter flavus Ellin428 TaxID=497964 RepID=B4D3P8_9BACT|nr:L,D-transpeptidase [Chthoniobacter flavus]EDY18878.1 ErfK/YbiS/YcfS/YnhG family protein [Chthoniobacter flavus Ellin428]TCO93469.1 L,D-transpeptidase-like protein [Chthoniobacter flavus]
MFRQIARGLLAAALAFGLASCATKPNPHLIRISVPDQKMVLFEHGVEIARYDISTSKFGVGDRPGSYATPLGEMEVREKIGSGQPSGMKFKNRRPTGEIVRPNTPGRDPIVSRILWLRGLEPQNHRAFDRDIYIHGTAEEWSIGTPASYGCIRMRSHDVIQLFDRIGVGTRVEVVNNHFPSGMVVGNGATAPAGHYNMETNPPTTAATTAAPASTPVPMAATAAPTPAKSKVTKKRSNGSTAPSAGPTPIPISRPASAGLTESTKTRS